MRYVVRLVVHVSVEAANEDEAREKAEDLIVEEDMISAEATDVTEEE